VTPSLVGRAGGPPLPPMPPGIEDWSELPPRVVQPVWHGPHQATVGGGGGGGQATYRIDAGLSLMIIAFQN
jgi:hypothetical protein